MANIRSMGFRIQKLDVRLHIIQYQYGELKSEPTLRSHRRHVTDDSNCALATTLIFTLPFLAFNFLVVRPCASRAVRARGPTSIIVTKSRVLYRTCAGA